jgi:hypothetical protein
MLKRVSAYLIRLQNLNRIAAGLSRAAALRAGRNTDPADPGSWEFSAFSQNGEDGIIDYLLQHVRDRNRYFIEIGVEDGLECNSAWLAIARKFNGLMIEGNAAKCRRAAALYFQVNLGVECLSAFVTKQNISQLLQAALHRNPDVFSLDIDGNDYYVAESIMNAGFRPKIFVVEYNSVFGPDRPVTIQYREDFDFISAHSTQLYYGVSIAAWKNFFTRHGYSFVTVDSNGVNAFFAAPDQFQSGFLERIAGYPYKENFYQLKKFKLPWQELFEKIEGQPLVSIS